jgi:hypothetical protein
MGFAALAVAVLALLSVWSVLGGMVLGIAAAALGSGARARVVRGEATNEPVAVAATMLGILSIVVALIFIPVWVGLIQVEIRQANYQHCVQHAGSNTYLQKICAR